MEESRESSVARDFPRRLKSAELPLGNYSHPYYHYLYDDTVDVYLLWIYGKMVGEFDEDIVLYLRIYMSELITVAVRDFLWELLGDW